MFIKDERGQAAPEYVLAIMLLAFLLINPLHILDINLKECISKAWAVLCGTDDEEFGSVGSNVEEEEPNGINVEVDEDEVFPVGFSNYDYETDTYKVVVTI